MILYHIYLTPRSIYNCYIYTPLPSITRLDTRFTLELRALSQLSCSRMENSVTLPGMISMPFIASPTWPLMSASFAASL